MIFLAKLGIGVMGVALVGGAAVSSEGFLYLKVREKQPDGSHINLVLPAALLPAVLRFVPNHHLAQASENLRPYLPIIDKAISTLEECPDGVIVEVRDANEHLVVSKRSHSIIVDATDHENTVEASVPLAAAQSSMHQIAQAN